MNTNIKRFVELRMMIRKLEEELDALRDGVALDVSSMGGTVVVRGVGRLVMRDRRRWIFSSAVEALKDKEKRTGKATQEVSRLLWFMCDGGEVID